MRRGPRALGSSILQAGSAHFQIYLGNLQGEKYSERVHGPGFELLPFGGVRPASAREFQICFGGNDKKNARESKRPPAPRAILGMIIRRVREISHN